MTKSLNGSPAEQSLLERLRYQSQMALFDESRHLRQREKQYVHSQMSGELLIIRETTDGWWKEDVQMKGNVEKQIQGLIDDPTVACGWVISQRFTEPGGWYDPS